MYRPIMNWSSRPPRPSPSPVPVALLAGATEVIGVNGAMANVHEGSGKVAGIRRLGERDDEGLSLSYRQGRRHVLSSRDACAQQRLAALRPADPHVRSKAR